MWQKALRVNYEPSVYVKAVKPSKEGEKDNLDKAICETLKYSVKPSDIAKDDDGGDWLHEMTKQTLNMRFIATGGVLKGVLKPEEEVTQEEMLTPSGQDEAQDEPKRIGFRYMPHYGKYVYSLVPYELLSWLFQLLSSPLMEMYGAKWRLVQREAINTTVYCVLASKKP